MRLKNKVAIVTGGAMGNGYGIVKEFLKEGADVIILDFSDQLMNTVKELQKEYQHVSGFQVDIRDAKKLKEIVKQIIHEKKQIDILVNNAGVAKLSSFLEMSDELRDYHFDINIKGTWNVTKEILPFMKERKYGRIVNLSSVTGPLVADTGEVAYATTKAALIGFTKGLAMEVVEDNITVNAIMPGYIMTPMVESIAKDSDASNPKSIINGIASGIPMKRLGTIEELGQLALFLASDESTYITGQGFVIDGGSTLPETKSVGI
ncbi:MAG: SDR family oxidoreductase UcpA [Bacilli bacterium]|jgi:NAD(P)-dependent dehydrogenase (short-subunit alcohol dehydrogenase family)|nr:SDR family oxidoreductase UcpA [Bacilli bacterium]